MPDRAKGVCENAQIAEIEINPFAIRNGRFGRIAIFQMDRRFRRGLMHRLLPQQVPGFKIDAVSYPTVNRCGRIGPIASHIITELKNTLSPHTIGEAQPRPGISTFQATFSVADHFAERNSPDPIPRAPGPRNWGQLDASVAKDASIRKTIKVRRERRRFMR